MAGPYYVDVTTGDDGDTGLTELLAWQTLHHAADTVNDGEIVYVKNSASYVVEDGSNDCVLYIDDAGATTGPIVWIGYNTVITDGGLVTIDADTNTLASAVISGVAGSCYNVFKNFIFTGGSSHGFDASADEYLKFENCRFTSNDGVGLFADNWITTINCQFDTNGTLGASVGNRPIFINPVLFGNATDGMIALYGSIINPLCYANGSVNRDIYFSDPHALVYGGSFDGENNGSHYGIRFANGCIQSVVVNSIFFDCGVGVYKGQDHGENSTARNNLFYSNGTDRTNFLTGAGDVSGSSDPFAASATRDYTLKSGSEAIDAGTDVSDTLDVFD